MEIKESLINYMQNGIKKTCDHLIGMEAEHFIIRRNTCEAVPYDGAGGVEDILNDLMKIIPETTALPSERLLGFTAHDYAVTLEPAAQLEISIDAKADIADIEKIYRSFLDSFNIVLDKYNYRYLAAGTQPVSKVRDLKLIPKERYYLMNRYFSGSGSGGIEMMRGTCSIQTSIDYYSEEDFTRKIRAASFYTPIFKLLSDNSRYFEGDKTKCRLFRTDIWNRTDPMRCGVLPEVFKENYSFGDYADFLLDMPLIYEETEKGNIYTENRTVREIYSERCPDEAGIIHIMSMAFPDVRVKQYLEIRAADSMPIESALAYCALVKGLMYSEEGLAYAEDFIRRNDLSEKDIINSERSLMQNGIDGMIYGKRADEIVTEILSIAGNNLPADEKNYLRAFEKAVCSEKTAGGIGA